MLKNLSHYELTQIKDLINSILQRRQPERTRGKKQPTRDPKLLPPKIDDPKLLPPKIDDPKLLQPKALDPKKRKS